MWKKESPEPSIPAVDPVQPGPAPRNPIQRNPVKRLKERAVIGTAIVIHGEVSGGQDLLVNGRIEGKVSLANQTLTVGREGRIKADMFAKLVSIEGSVEGTIQGEEKIVLRGTGSVRGNLIAPQVVLEEGCRFKGSIDMGDKNDDQESSAVDGKESQSEDSTVDAVLASPGVVSEPVISTETASPFPKA
ncbi:MAG: polymer-forming cytoskeletal protein [Acidobacteriota bacterium]|nr:polymer-forming cytoskeletal protein [Acidobacteriota bacterium]